jgi:site-specific DNA-cytosine methylase
MKLLELFSGSCTVSTEAKKRGCDVRNLDIIGDPTYKEDILKWDYKEALKDWKPDIIWASPPCTEFSMMKNLCKNGRDLDKGRILLLKALEIISYLKPSTWFIENPVGLMRHQPEMIPIGFRHTCSYCHYGESYRKNTDIWSNIELELRRCRKGDCGKTIENRHTQICTQGRTFQDPERAKQQKSAGGTLKIQAIPTPLIVSIFDQVGL